jgi:hypothetical protein
VAEGQAERGADHPIGRHHLGRAAALGHGRELGIEAAGEGRDGVGAGQAGLAQGKVARMDPRVGIRQPPGCLPVGDASPQTFSNRRRCGGRGCLQPSHGVRCVGERHEEGMGIRVAARLPAPERGQKLGRIIVGEIAQWLGRQDENKEGFSFGIFCGVLRRQL